MLPKGVEECQRAGNVKRTGRTDRKWDGLVADLELRLEAVAMWLLGRIGAKGLTQKNAGTESECRESGCWKT